jgi:hypothetical protein
VGVTHIISVFSSDSHFQIVLTQSDTMLQSSKQFRLIGVVTSKPVHSGANNVIRTTGIPVHVHFTRQFSTPNVSRLTVVLTSMWLFILNNSAKQFFKPSFKVRKTFCNSQVRNVKESTTDTDSPHMISPLQVFYEAVKLYTVPISVGDAVAQWLRHYAIETR